MCGPLWAVAAARPNSQANSRSLKRGGVKIECIEVKDLYGFYCKTAKALQPGQIAPISRTRALSWTKNPYAREDDVGLLVAYVGDRCVGYLGSMPARVKIDGRLEPIYWLSTYYVPPEVRDAGIGALLLMRAIGLKYSLAAVGPTREAQQVYRKLGFREPTPLSYFLLDVKRVDIYNRPLRALRGALRRLGIRWGWLERGINSHLWLSKKVLYGLMLTRLSHYEPSVFTRRANVLLDSSFEIEKDRTAAVRFYRDVNVVNWMLSSGWVATGPDPDTPSYYFDDFREHSEYRLLEVYETKGSPYKGFVVLRLTERYGSRDLHVLDYHIQNLNDGCILARLAIEHASSFGADRVFLPAVCEDELRLGFLTRQLFQKKTRAYFCRPGPNGQALDASLDRITLDYCDGDIPFA